MRTFTNAELDALAAVTEDWCPPFDERTPPTANCLFTKSGNVFAWLALDARSDKRSEVGNK